MKALRILANWVPAAVTAAVASLGVMLAAQAGLVSMAVMFGLLGAMMTAVNIVDGLKAYR